MRKPNQSRTPPSELRVLMRTLLAERSIRQVDLARAAGFTPETLVRMMDTDRIPHRRNVVAMVRALSRIAPIDEAVKRKLVRLLGYPETLCDDLAAADADAVAADLGAPAITGYWEAEQLVRQLLRELGPSEVLPMLRGMLAVAQRRNVERAAPGKPRYAEPEPRRFTVVSPPRDVGGMVEQTHVEYEVVKPARAGDGAGHKAAGKARRRSS